MLSHLVALSDILAISDVSHNAEKYVVIVTSLQCYKCLSLFQLENRSDPNNN